MSANARETVEGSKFFDNWSVGVAGGVYTPMTHHAFFGSMRPTANLTIAKQITPVYGLAVEGATAFNTKKIGWESRNAFDAVNVNLLNQFNLTNLFKGYNGSPRPVELVAVWGLGWGHLFMDHSDINGDDYNMFTSKTGLNINFNICPAVQINVKPAVVWNMAPKEEMGEHSDWKYNANYGALELTAGVTYKFKNSNGTHNFKLAKLYDQAEVDGLNAQVNDLRSNVNRLNSEISNKNQQIKTLQEQLNDCRNRKPTQVNKSVNVYESGSMVTFRQGKSVVDASQYANVERVATYLKNHKDATVVIEGYASPEGSAAVNEALAQKRADAVKNMLVKKYKIAANRITAKGKGVGNMFSEADWNRVSISTIKK